MRRTLWLATVGAATLVAFAPLPADRIEAWYSQHAYLLLQRQLTWWSNLIPVAVTDLLLAGVLLAAAAGVRRWLRGSRARARWRSALRAVAVLAVAWSAVYLWFMLAWGLNYRRQPLRTRLDFDRSRVTPEAVAGLAREVAGRAGALHDRAHAGGWPAWQSLPALMGPAFERVQRQLADAPPAIPGRPKWSLLTFYFERSGVAGMTSPFALEVVVDWSQLPFERPFVAAHEWAHLAGYAGEDEANFVGWLVCLQGPPAAQYSGNLALLASLLNSLPASGRHLVLEAAGPGPARDLQAIRDRSSRTWRWLRRPAWWVYDRYLRANRVELGVRSYGAALELMVGTRLEGAGLPLRRHEHGERR